MFKMTKFAGLAVAASLALGLSSAVATAAPFVSVTTSPAAFTGLVPGDSLNVAGGTWSVPVPSIVSGSAVGEYRSPFDTALDTDLKKAQYYTVGSPTPMTPSPAILTFASVKYAFSILWGSVDMYNKIVFSNSLGGGTQQVVGDDVTLPASEGSDAALVFINGLDAFDTVSFFSNHNVPKGDDIPAFEFAYAVAAVPLPAGVLLLLTAVGGFGVARRMRKSA